jgi:protoporphyrinogen oxidase
VKYYKYMIFGAGPSGLGFAHTLLKGGEDSFLVLEKEETVGGLCRSEDVDGSPLDIGGGHFLDVKRSQVLDLLFEFMPRSDWREHIRISKIALGGCEIDYPLEANIWQLSVQDQLAFLESIARAGSVIGSPMPESFEAWIAWKLGDRIAEEYMLPYNRKIWSCDLNELGVYWLYKLPDVSFRDTLRSCLERKPFGLLPAHGHFLYPREYGYGEVWRRMGNALGDRLLTSTPVTKVDLSHMIVNGEFRASRIVTSIPWTIWPGIADIPSPIQACIDSLRKASIDVDYRPETLSTRAHWIYIPDEGLPYHRILCRSNFCKGSRGYWTETNSKRAEGQNEWRWRNEYAYPLNTRKKPGAIAEICRWAEERRILPLGRWGLWEHMNSDVAVAEAMAAGQRALQNRGSMP